ncbi:hypothetical protein GPECTOR_541g547 [Gonium pectorale]|uniref:Hedgehog protein Hint domain-containing protein n=1 Tax=Gonium pectorale TaxID=33097 RepID=A0A150FVV4_GONPE|nr:hypothetical protein GPECTOR_541g547 [Gonium pectorale]|eukprot:KXZ41335.1 hypothetical protein GPECTOR_541g547 [Gonium pectorale]
MLKEQQIGKIYKFMTIGLFIVVAVLIGALTGITWAIVQISKDTKVTNSNNANNYQFLVTKDDKAAVTGSVLLDIAPSLRAPTAESSSAANFSASFKQGGSRHRMLVSVDDYPADQLVLYGTLGFPTVEEGCSALHNGLSTFQIAHDSATVADGVSYTSLTVVEVTGCKDLSSKEVTAIVTDGTFRFFVICRPGMVRDDAAKTGMCEYGDRVRSRDRRTGELVYREVYLFGHREADRVNPYVHLTAGGRTLVGTQRHFLPVCVSRCTQQDLEAGSITLENRRFEDVRVGDLLLLSAGGSSFALAPVTAVDVMLTRGAYNPYVRGADLVVDGVVASPHSDWILDWAAPASMDRYLPYVYEVLLAPVYGLYRIVGPSTAEWLAHGLGLAESGAESGLGYYVVVAAMAAPLATALAAASRKLVTR